MMRILLTYCYYVINISYYSDNYWYVLNDKARRSFCSATIIPARLQDVPWLQNSFCSVAGLASAGLWWLAGFLICSYLGQNNASIVIKVIERLTKCWRTRLNSWNGKFLSICPFLQRYCADDGWARPNDQSLFFSANFIVQWQIIFSAFSASSRYSV